MRRRRRDGSGRGAHLTPGTGGRCSAPAVAIAAAPRADAPATDVPTGASRARSVAVVARPESCIACGACVETCPRNAITLEETAVIDASSCTGCGLCVSDCAQGALTLAEV